MIVDVWFPDECTFPGSGTTYFFECVEVETRRRDSAVQSELFIEVRHEAAEHYSRYSKYFVAERQSHPEAYLVRNI